MECVSCGCDLGASIPPMLMTCGHLCCESCLGPEKLIQCTSCNQVALVASRLFVSVAEDAVASVQPFEASMGNVDRNESTPEDLMGPDESTSGVRGADAEACLSTAIQEIRRFTEKHLSPTTIGELRLRNQDARRRVSTKMSTYFAIRQRNVQMQKQNADLLRELAEGHRSLKEAKRQLSRQSAVLSKNQRMHKKEVDDLNAAIARASQSVERRMRHERRANPASQGPSTSSARSPTNRCYVLIPPPSSRRRKEATP